MTRAAAIKEALGRFDMKHSIRGAFMERSLRAMVTLADELPQDALSSVLAERTDREAVLRALEQALAIRLPRERENDPLALARVRGIEAREKLLCAEGGVLSATEVAGLLRISRQAVAKRRKTGSLLAVNLGGRADIYPAWQLVEEGLLPGLGEILRLLAKHSDWTKLRFFLSANLALDGQRPLDLLRAGRTEPVRRAAKLVGEQGPA